MNKFKARIVQLEKKLNIHREQIFIILPNWNNYVEPDYFKDEKEKEAFLEWRTSLIKKEQKKNIEPWIIYDFSLTDVQVYLPAFRKLQPLI